MLIEHGVTGMLVNPDAPDASFEPGKAILDNARLRNKMSKAAASAMKNRTWTANNQRLLDYYSEVVNNHRSKGKK